MELVNKRERLAYTTFNSDSRKSLRARMQQEFVMITPRNVSRNVAERNVGIDVDISALDIFILTSVEKWAQELW